MNYNLKKALMFGMDARIALVILAVVSLSIGLVTEKQLFKDSTLETKQQMNILQAKFLKNFEKVFFAGNYTTPTGYTKSVNNYTIADIAGFNKDDKNIRMYKSGAYNTQTLATVYTHPTNADNYVRQIRLDNLNYNTIAYIYSKENYFNRSANYFVDFVNSISSTLNATLNEFAKEDGSAVFATTDIFEPDTSILSTFSTNLTVFNAKRNALNRDVKFYFIIEQNIDSYSPSDYIINVVMYNLGANDELDTTLPTTLTDLYNFAGAVGDDIVNVFSTKDIYLKAKAEGLDRLNTIKERILQVAQANYLDKISLCRSQVTVTSACDLDADSDYDVQDENLLVDYNPFSKSSLDTSGANYYNTSTAFNFTSSTGAESFLINTLGLPGYYSVDLFGNILNYQSNIGLRTSGPYSMEVWY